MNLPASEIPNYLHPDVACVCLRDRDGAPCCEITIEALNALVARDFVIGIGYARRGKFHLRHIALTVGSDIAFREIGETRLYLKDSLQSDASVTVERSFETAPRHVKRHHQQHCMAFYGQRHVLPDLPGRFVADYSALTPSEIALLSQKHRVPLRPPMVAA